MIKYVAVPCQNHFARITTHRTDGGRVRTATQNRDDGFNVAVSRDPQAGRTTVYVHLPNYGEVRLTGAQARTLFRVLDRHYAERSDV